MKPKTYDTAELQLLKALDVTPRVIISTEKTEFYCYLCGTIGTKQITEAVKSQKKLGFAYQCAACLKQKTKNRSQNWLENVRKAAQSEAHKERARQNGTKGNLKYTEGRILEVLRESGVTYSGDVTSPNNTIIVMWPDGVTRSIRIRRFMIAGRIDRPKTRAESTNHIKFMNKLKAMGVSVCVVGEEAELEYRGHKWQQKWSVGHLNKTSIRKIKNINIAIDLQDLLDRGMPLNRACKALGVDPNRYYKDRRAGIDVSTTAMATQEFQQYIRTDGAIYNKTLRPTAYRPDILVESHKLIIETDGMRYHSEEFKQKNYHITRWYAFRKMGYQVLAFSEYEVKEKKHIVDSMIGHKTGKSTKIYARECEVVDLSPDQANDFFETNHLKGRGQGHCLALMHKSIIVCAMRFVNETDSTINISRFCNVINHSVIGGYSKLLSKLPADKDIINFVDHRHGSGDGLLALGFVKVKTHIGFEWTNGYLNYNRRKFPSNSGYEHGLKKFWDYGQAKYIRKGK